MFGSEYFKHLELIERERLSAYARIDADLVRLKIEDAILEPPDIGVAVVYASEGDIDETVKLTVELVLQDHGVDPAAYNVPRKHRSRQGYPYGEYQEFDIHEGRLGVIYTASRGLVRMDELETTKNPINEDWHVAVSFAPRTDQYRNLLR